MIYLFLADGFEEMEAIVPLDVLRRAGLQVTTVGVTGKTVRGSHDITVTADTTDVKLTTELDMIVLPGGTRGVENLRRSGLVQHAIEFAAHRKIKIAAICAAPTLLAERGLLEGVEATCFPDLSDRMHGAVYTGADVCVSGNLITAKSAGHSKAFGLKLVEVLQDAQSAEETARSLDQNG